MLPRKYRLTEKREFQRVFSRGSSTSTPYYTVRWARSTAGVPRFGFIIANAVTKKAVERNTIRRRLRESVRRNLEQFTAPVDIVFIARRGIVGVRSRDIEPQVLHTIDIIKKRTSGIHAHRSYHPVSKTPLPRP